MRVTTGSAKGRRLVAPPGGAVRPATDRLKQALFNALFDVTDERVLDLYAGSGGLGIEALSRGAAHATFVDSSPAAVDAVRRNLDVCGFTDRADVRRGDVVAAVSRVPVRPWDLVFVDPPYDVDSDALGVLMQALGRPGVCSGTARMALERRTGDPAPPLPDGFTFVRTKAYGQTTLFVAERRGV